MKVSKKKYYAGAGIIGAALAGLAAFWLSKPENQKKANDVLTKVNKELEKNRGKDGRFKRKGVK